MNDNPTNDNSMFILKRKFYIILRMLIKSGLYEKPCSKELGFKAVASEPLFIRFLDIKRYVGTNFGDAKMPISQFITDEYINLYNEFLENDIINEEGDLIL